MDGPAEKMGISGKSSYSQVNGSLILSYLFKGMLLEHREVVALGRLVVQDELCRTQAGDREFQYE